MWRLYQRDITQTQFASWARSLSNNVRFCSYWQQIIIIANPSFLSTHLSHIAWTTPPPVPLVFWSRQTKTPSVLHSVTRGGTKQPPTPQLHLLCLNSDCPHSPFPLSVPWVRWYPAKSKQLFSNVDFDSSQVKEKKKPTQTTHTSHLLRSQRNSLLSFPKREQLYNPYLQDKLISEWIKTVEKQEAQS